ncbi:pilus assembly protein TadG-related protein [Virgibacillus sp. W0430]|uniref:pilus assembly protein TadG-related protein n=1 Tax=Virgibacillus sp. W0430 TaxID=3391580 RepID=UPI003F47C76A
MMKIIFQFMLRAHKEQAGSTMILVAFSMFMIIGFTAIVVDAGSLYFEKSKLQKALDAAVLGGAQRLTISVNESKQVATNLAAKNGYTIPLSDVRAGEKYIEVSQTVRKELTFAKLIGFNSADVGADARAEIASGLLRGNEIIPIGIEKKDFAKGATYKLNETPGKGDSGNYGYLAIGGRGAADLENGIKTGLEQQLGNVDTEPGVQWGKVRSAFNDREADDTANRPYCSDYHTADKTCKRVVIIPVVEEFKNGRSSATIIGFAAFWIESVKDKEIKGKFIEIVTDGDFEPGPDYGIYGVKLTN